MPGILDVTVVLLEAGFTSTAIGPAEVFVAAGQLWNALHGGRPEPRFRVRVASLDGQPVEGPCGLRLLPAACIDDIEQTDIIILSSTGLQLDQHLVRHGKLLPWLRRWHERGAYVAGVCAGVVFLAESGLLDGRRATTHWALADRLRERYPAVKWQPDHFVTEDGRMFCSGGVYAAIDLSLYLVEKFCGHEIALQCAKSLLVSMPRSRQSGYAVQALSRPHEDAKIKIVEEYLQQHYDRNVPTETLAQLAALSTRTLIRRFKAATGRLPGTYLQLLRVTAAKEMLERGAASVQAVCSKVGYEDIAFFRAVFKRHTGMTPAAYRSHFAKLIFERGALTPGRVA